MSARASSLLVTVDFQGPTGKPCVSELPEHAEAYGMTMVQADDVVHGWHYEQLCLPLPKETGTMELMTMLGIEVHPGRWICL